MTCLHLIACAAPGIVATFAATTIPDGPDTLIGVLGVSMAAALAMLGYSQMRLFNLITGILRDVKDGVDKCPHHSDKE